MIPHSKNEMRIPIWVRKVESRTALVKEKYEVFTGTVQSVHEEQDENAEE